MPQREHISMSVENSKAAGPLPEPPSHHSRTTKKPVASTTSRPAPDERTAVPLPMPPAIRSPSIVSWKKPSPLTSTSATTVPPFARSSPVKVPVVSKEKLLPAMEPSMSSVPSKSCTAVPVHCERTTQLGASASSEKSVAVPSITPASKSADTEASPRKTDAELSIASKRPPFSSALLGNESTLAIGDESLASTSDRKVAKRGSALDQPEPQAERAPTSTKAHTVL